MTSFKNHPLYHGSLILPTKSLEKFVNALNLWLDSLIPGGIIYGNSRVGKSSAIKYLMTDTEACLNLTIPTVVLSMWEPTHTNGTENRFFLEMLNALGYGITEGRGSKLRRRTIEYMVDAAFEHNEHRHLVFIDEAQWLTLSQFKYLMDLHNQLRMKSVQMVTILVGTHQLLTMRKNFREVNKTHLLGRFMMASHEFTGVMGLDDFRITLEALDENSEYTACSGISSGISYTQAFVPKAFNATWRMVDQAGEIWSSLSEILENEGISHPDEIPMQPITAIIRWILLELSKRDGSDLHLNKKLIKEAIYRVALTQIENYAYQNSQD